MSRPLTHNFKVGDRVILDIEFSEYRHYPDHTYNGIKNGTTGVVRSTNEYSVVVKFDLREATMGCWHLAYDEYIPKTNREAVKMCLLKE